jgi:hypothetical protein
VLLLIAVIKTLAENVFTFPESQYMPIITCTTLLLQAEWTSVLTNEDRRITSPENSPRNLPGIELGTSRLVTQRLNLRWNRSQQNAKYFQQFKGNMTIGQTLVTIREAVGWNTEPTWSLLCREKPLLLPGIEQRHRDRPARRLVTILTELSFKIKHTTF